jgi:SLBB domain
MDGYRKFFYIFGALIALSFIAVFLPGCTSDSKAEADARAAYIAGQRAAFDRMAAMRRTSVVVIGPVENPKVEWTNGLTLARAILDAKYAGVASPTGIMLTRQGQTTRINVQNFLQGQDVPLQPGDIITIQE